METIEIKDLTGLFQAIDNKAKTHNAPDAMVKALKDFAKSAYDLGKNGVTTMEVSDVES